MDATKAPVAHAHNLVARLSGGHHLLHQGLNLVAHHGFSAHGRERLSSIPAQAAAVAKRHIGFFQAPGQLGLHGAQLHGVGARLKHRHNALAGLELAAQAIDRGANGGGVVGKVVIHRDAAYLAAQFHAALDVLEIRQGLTSQRRGHAHMLGSRYRSQGIELVMHAGHAPLHTAHGAALELHRKVGRLAVGGPVAHRGAKAALLAPAALLQHPGQAFFEPVEHHTPLLGHGAHQVVELALNGGQVVKNVGVVKLKVVENGRAGAVVHKFAALVKKRRVVFIGFDHEQRAALGRAYALLRDPQPCRYAKVQRHATYQKARLQACVFQNPSEHRRGGGLAMRAGHRHHMAALQNMLAHPLRAAGVAGAAVQNRFHEWELGLPVGPMRTRHHIAHHKHIGLQGHLIGPKAFNEVDA